MRLDSLEHRKSVEAVPHRNDHGVVLFLPGLLRQRGFPSGSVPGNDDERVAGVLFFQPSRGAPGNNASVVDDGNVVSAGRFLHVMRGEEDGHLLLFLHGGD